MAKKKNLTPEILDALIERPYGFRIGTTKYYLHPSPLGKTLILSARYEQLGIDLVAMKADPMTEIRRIVGEKRTLCLEIIAMATLHRKEDILDSALISMRAAHMGEMADDNDIATLLYAVMTRDDRLKDIRKSIGLVQDAERKRKVMKVKQSKNNFVFGGVSIYGSVIDAACQRYGWTYDYVMWGISYMNLQLMLEDQISTIYLSDKELKDVHLSNDREVISGDDPKNWARIREQLKG